MSQSVLGAAAAAASDTERGDAPFVGAWAQIPPPAPGAFRVRPLPYEANASYLQRLASVYRLTLPQLLDGTGITLNGHGTTPAATLVLSSTAASRVAEVARLRPDALARALPGLTQDSAKASGPAIARWRPVERQHQAVAACPLCTRHHSQGTTRTAWTHRPWHQLICPRHQQAAPDPRLDTPLRTRAVPELVTAHTAHQRLNRNPRGASAWMAALAITTRWYDHQQHLTERWHQRLHRLMKINAHLDRGGNASAALLARDLVIYPEAVILARTLAALPHQSRARSTREVLGVIAHHLQLDIPPPVTGDPLTVYLTHTRP